MEPFTQRVQAGHEAPEVTSSHRPYARTLCRAKRAFGDHLRQVNFKPFGLGKMSCTNVVNAIDA